MHTVVLPLPTAATFARGERVASVDLIYISPAPLADSCNPAARGSNNTDLRESRQEGGGNVGKVGRVCQTRVSHHHTHSTEPNGHQASRAWTRTPRAGGCVKRAREAAKREVQGRAAVGGMSEQAMKRSALDGCVLCVAGSEVGVCAIVCISLYNASLARYISGSASHGLVSNLPPAHAQGREPAQKSVLVDITTDPTKRSGRSLATSKRARNNTHSTANA